MTSEIGCFEKVLQVIEHLYSKNPKEEQLITKLLIAYI